MSVGQSGKLKCLYCIARKHTHKNNLNNKNNHTISNVVSTFSLDRYLDLNFGPSKLHESVTVLILNDRPRPLDQIDAAE